MNSCCGTGPRVDMTAADLLQPPISHDLTELAAATLASPGTLDTAVCVSYRATAHSLIVKTDALNATFVYGARSGWWLLLSNSSLTLRAPDPRRCRLGGGLAISRERLDLRELQSLTRAFGSQAGDLACVHKR